MIHLIGISALFILLTTSSIGFSEEAHHQQDSHSHSGHEEHHEGNHGSTAGHDELGHDDEHQDEHDHSDSKFGEGKAIIAVEQNGNQFKLSQKAERTLGIELLDNPRGTGNRSITVPPSSIMESQDKKGIYVKREGWFVFVEVDVISSGPSNVVTIKSPNISEHDKIVTAGVALLRIAHLEASGQGGQGHAH